MAPGVPESVVVLIRSVVVGGVVPLDALTTAELRLGRAVSPERVTRGGQAGLHLAAMTPAPGRPVDQAVIAATARQPDGRAAPGQRLRGLPGQVRRAATVMVRAAVTATASAVAGTTAPAVAVPLAPGRAVPKARAVRPRELAGTTVWPAPAGAARRTGVLTSAEPSVAPPDRMSDLRVPDRPGGQAGGTAAIHELHGVRGLSGPRRPARVRRPGRLGGLTGASGLSVLDGLERPGGRPVPAGLSGLTVAAGLIVMAGPAGPNGLTVVAVQTVGDGSSGLAAGSGTDARGRGGNAACGRRRIAAPG